jgi:DNA-binding NarL/FixJ family response regulator
MKSVLIVEDDLDIQVLIQAIFSMDPRFSVAGLADSAEEALTMAIEVDPEIIVLDDGLAGTMSGVDAAPQIKAAAPRAKIILFTSHLNTKARVDIDPSVDAYLLKTESAALLPVAQQLAHLLALI